MTVRRRARLTVAVGNEPPTEFRIFTSGSNPTSKGTFLFDAQAAKAVMDAFKKSGVDVMIDLEHLSLDSESNSYDPNARGWCQLALRGGELWAVNVKWTDDGAARLRKREQRYISPTFTYDSETARVGELYNIAICAIPATLEAPALVAASKRTGKHIAILSVEVPNMDVTKILAALGLPDDATEEQVLAAIATLQDSGDDSSEVTTSDDPMPTPAKDQEKLGKILHKHPMLLARTFAKLSNSDASVTALAALEKRVALTECEQLIRDNVEKIPKHMESYVKSLEPVALRMYLKHAQPQPKPATEPAKPAGGEALEVKLTDADLEFAKLNKMDPAKVLEFKKAKAAKK